MNWQTAENFTQKRRDSLLPREEGVILQPADFRRFLALFPRNGSEPFQEVSVVNGKPTETNVLFPYTRPHGLPDNCVGQFSCLAQYLEWSAAQGIFGQFKPADPDERVYFIGAEDGPVKIGLTNDPPTSLQHLQTASPVELRLLAVVRGGRSLERAYHRCFGRFRIRGEWFERNPMMMDEIRHWSAKCRRKANA